MTFLLRRTLFNEDPVRSHALDEWRTAASLVRERWDRLLIAEPTARPASYAAYVAALDLEAAAADELAGLSFRQAA